MYSHTDDILTLVNHHRLIKERLIADPYRPGYHFAVPSDNGIPGDPNGAFYANGRYHLMYLYQCRADGFRWGHMSSIDLVHWHHHPDALIPDDLDGGIFSGGAYVDEDGCVYLSYWALPGKETKGGIRVAYSNDAEHHYESWTKVPEYAISGTHFGFSEDHDENGVLFYRGASDPSNIWKKDGRYYMEAGALEVLNRFRNDPNAPAQYRGDWTDLYSTDDPKKGNWRYEHRFYQRDVENRWTQESEDDMCPSFYPLPATKVGGVMSDKYLQTFIAHNRGTQYYIGTYDRERDLLIPEQHGRMSWVDNTYFAPEAILTPDGRYVLFAWLLDNQKDELTRFGWSGVYALPRELWLNEQGGLGIAPHRELAMLEYGAAQGDDALTKTDKKSRRLTLTARVGANGKVGFRLFANAEGTAYADLYYDAERRELVFDESKAGKLNCASPDVTPWIDPATREPVLAERAPFALEAGELLTLTCYIDGPVMDAFANDRQAITRRVCTENPDARREVSLLCENGEILSLDGCSMMPSNMY